MLVRHYTPVCSAGSIKVYTIATPMYNVGNFEVMLKLCKNEGLSFSLALATPYIGVANIYWHCVFYN